MIRVLVRHQLKVWHHNTLTSFKICKLTLGLLLEVLRDLHFRGLLCYESEERGDPFKILQKQENCGEDLVGECHLPDDPTRGSSQNVSWLLFIGVPQWMVCDSTFGHRG